MAKPGLCSESCLRIATSTWRVPGLPPAGAAKSSTVSTSPKPVGGKIMATKFNCPYLNAQVELTDERERHIVERHPDLLPDHRQRIADTLVDPDQVRQSARLANARMFSRWFESVRGGKHVVVVVVSDSGPDGRHWIITAYIARKLAEGAIEWKRD